MKSVAVFLVILFVSLISSESHAAKCKYQWDTVSYRTGEKVLWTRWAMNRGFYRQGIAYGFVSGVSEGGRKYLGFQLVGDNKVMNKKPTKEAIDAALVVPEGAKLTLQLADDSTQELFAEKRVVADTKVKLRDSGDYVLSPVAVIKFPLSVADLDALHAQPVKSLRLQLSDRAVELSFGKKPSDKIQKVLACIL